MNMRMVHTSSRIPRVEVIAFVCGSNFCKNSQKCKTDLQDFWRTRPASSATDATAEIGVKIDTVALIDLKILSRCRRSLKACVLSCNKVVTSSMEWQRCSWIASESSQSANVMPAFFS